MRKTTVLLSLVLLLAACSVRPSATEAPATPVGTEAASPLTAENFAIGVRVTTRLTPQQIAFVNRNYHFVMTPSLGQTVRDAVQGPRLILYRSIQGTWEGFEQFDWEHINAHENMFEHHDGERIITRWHSYLMNADDLVDADATDALDHWINYYAVTAAEQVQQYGYDGLFVDSASHWLNPWAVFDKMPDDYDAEEWYRARVAGLAFVKSYLPDEAVIFNGLHNEHGAEDSLANTDGGMWETFAFQPRSGRYQGEEKWQAAIELTARHPDKFIVLVVKEQPDLVDDVQKRVFAVASYLLVSRPNVVFSMTDAAHAATGSIMYYPEYTLDLGAPLGAYTVGADGLYSRRFERGRILVNPSESRTLTFTPDGTYQRVVPVGGGAVPADGSWNGSLEYEPLSGPVEIPPLSGLILVVP